MTAPLTQNNFISSREASALSGYNSDYLGRLCRDGIISGTKIGRAWLIDRVSLLAFVENQTEHKKKQAQALSKAREKEYKVAQKRPLQASNQRRTPVISPYPISTSFARSKTTDAFERATALAVSLLVLNVGLVFSASELLPASARFVLENTANISDNGQFTIEKSLENLASGAAVLKEAHETFGVEYIDAIELGLARYKGMLAQGRATVAGALHNLTPNVVGEQALALGVAVRDYTRETMWSAASAQVAFGTALSSGSQTVLDTYTQLTDAWVTKSREVAPRAFLAIYEASDTLVTGAAVAPHSLARTANHIAVAPLEVLENARSSTLDASLGFVGHAALLYDESKTNLVATLDTRIPASRDALLAAPSPFPNGGFLSPFSSIANATFDVLYGIGEAAGNLIASLFSPSVVYAPTLSAPFFPGPSSTALQGTGQLISYVTNVTNVTQTYPITLVQGGVTLEQLHAAIDNLRMDLAGQDDDDDDGGLTDLSGSSIEDLGDVATMTENFGDLLYWNGSSWADIATSSLGITSGSSYPFPDAGNATSTLTQFNGGLTAFASSTIGSGVQAGGLTILGGATTTGNAYFASNIGVGTTSPYAKLSVVGETVASHFTATTSATSTFPNVSISGALSLFGTYGTSLSAFCTAITGGSGLCDGADNTGGGSGLSTSTDIADTYVIYGTSASDVGAEAAFTYDDAIDRLTVPYASTTAFSSLYASATSLFALNATTTSLAIGGDYFTELVGTGLQVVGNALTLNATGDWTGTIDGNNFADGAVEVGDLLYGSAGGTISEVNPGTNGFVLAMSGGIPTWVATSSINNGVTSIQQTGGGSAQTGAITFATSSDTNLLFNITNSGAAFTFTPVWTGTLAYGRGGTGTTTAPIGQLLYGGSSAYQSVATSSLAVGNGLTTTSGTLGFQVGGTNASIGLAAIAANSVLGNNTGGSAVPTAVATSSLFAGTNGQVLARVNGTWTGVATTTAGTGLTYDGTSFNVNASQNITTLSNLTTDGVIYTSGGNGTLNVDAGALDIARGGTNATSFASNSLVFFNGTSLVATSSHPLYVGAIVATSSVASTFAGSVGIATTSPFGLFSVEQGTETASLWVGNTGSTSPSLVIEGVNGNGHVGIGIADPTAPLHVNSGFDIITARIGNLILERDGSGYQRIEEANGWYSIRPGGDTYFDTGGGFGIEDQAPDAELEVSGDAVTTGNLFLLSSDDGNDGNLLTFSRFGRMGIGTTTPQWNLQVATSTGPQLALSDGSATSNHWTLRSIGGELYFATASPATFATTSTAALTVSGSGFGTTTLRGLSIIGQATSTSNVGFNITTGCYAISGTCVGGGSGSGTVNTGTTGFFAYYPSSGTTVDDQTTLFLSTAGDVGLGTSGPFDNGAGINSLTIDGSTTGYLDISVNGIKQGVLYNSGATFRIGNAVASPLALITDDTERVTVTGTGNVGISTTSPFGLFSVEQGTETASLWVGNTGSSSPSLVVRGVNGNGNIGIGTSSPASQLAIDSDDGNILFGTSVFTGKSASTDTGIELSDSGRLRSGLFTEVDGTILSYGINVSQIGGQDTATVGGIFRLDTRSSVPLEANGRQAFIIKGVPVGGAEVTRFTVGLETGNTYLAPFNGLVGVGTTTPQWLLNPASSTAPQLVLSAGAGFGQWAFRNAGGNLYLATTTVEGTATSSSALTILSATGATGIGTTSPRRPLHIENTNPSILFFDTDAVMSATRPAWYAGAAATNFQIGTTTDFSTFTPSLVIGGTTANVGIGTTTPWRRLSVTDAVSTAQVVISQDTTNYAQLLVDSTGDLTIDVEGTGTTDDVFLGDGNIWACTGGCSAITLTGGHGYLYAETGVALGTTTPWAGVSVVSGKAIVVAENTLATSTSMSVDWRNGNQQLVRLGTAGTTISFTGFIEGQKLLLTVCNPNATAGAVTWGTQILWAGGSAPTQTTTANKCDVWSFLATVATSTLKIFGTQNANF